jgi:hypothetical protein
MGSGAVLGSLELSTMRWFHRIGCLYAIVFWIFVFLVIVGLVAS